MKELKRLKLLTVVSVCYRMAIEALEHLGIKELEEMANRWFATADASF